MTELKLKTLKDIIKQWSKEMKIHLDQFGKGENRDIDTREKGTMVITPIILEKRIRELAIKWVKEWKSDERLSYPSATISENAPLALIQLELETKINTLMEFANISEEDLK